MDQKNRAVFSMAVILLIFLALLISFGRSVFNTETPEVILPTVESSTPEGGQSPEQEDAGTHQTVSVTPQTVQSVIATLERTDSYYRQITVEQFWVGGASSTAVQTWVDHSWTHSRQQTASGVVRHDLTGPDQSYFWYDGYSRYETASADDRSADLAQRIPTYETVLELDPDSITAAGYMLQGELPCIYVCSEDSDSRTTREYWVSVDNGLLVCAELRLNGEVIYRMSAPDPLQSPCPATASFALPDGTVLHTP